MGEPIYKRIEARIRGLIAEGAFAEGAMLPSVRELAEKFGTNVFTVHKALTPLEEEGLIERRRKLGTVVTKGSPKLACVGLYFASSFLYDEEMGFYRRLCERLTAKLDELGWGHRLWTETLGAGDSRVKGAQVESVLKAVEARRIQGLIAPMANSPAYDALSQIKIPTAFISTGQTKSNVRFDFESLHRISLTRLKEQGCRSAGLITNVYGKGVKEEGPRCHEFVKFHRSFLKIAGELGLETREEWTRCPEPGVILDSQTRFGYREFASLWELKERPEGLLVYSDMTARGAVSAILERRIEVPRDLKLVLHKNSGVDTLCPLKASWAVTDVQAVANALVDLIKDQAAGKSASPKVIPFVLE